MEVSLPKILAETELGSGNWLKLKKVDFQVQSSGKTYSWEVCDRISKQNKENESVQGKCKCSEKIK